MNKALTSEWEQVKIKLQQYREAHFRDGMLRAAALVESFPSYGWSKEARHDRAKQQRIAKMIRREANQDRRGRV
jgi:hypothetical protein